MKKFLVLLCLGLICSLDYVCADVGGNADIVVESLICPDKPSFEVASVVEYNLVCETVTEIGFNNVFDAFNVIMGVFDVPEEVRIRLYFCSLRKADNCCRTTLYRHYDYDCYGGIRHKYYSHKVLGC